MKNKEFTITFKLERWVIDILENTAELARLKTGRDLTADDVAKAIIMSTVGKCGDDIIY